LHAALDITKVRNAMTAASMGNATAFTGRYSSYSRNHVHHIECRSTADRDAIISVPLTADSIFKSVEPWKPWSGSDQKMKETGKPKPRKRNQSMKPTPKPTPNQKTSDGNRYAALAASSGSESDSAAGKAKRKTRAKPKPGHVTALPSIPASPPAAAAGTAGAHATVSPNTLIKTVFDGVARTIAAAVAARPLSAANDSKGVPIARDLSPMFDSATNDDAQLQPRSRSQSQSQLQSKSKLESKSKSKSNAGSKPRSNGAAADCANGDDATDTGTDTDADSDTDSNDSAIANAIAAAVASALRKAKSKGKAKSRAKGTGKGNAKQL
jgi:hypothetical protein